MWQYSLLIPTTIYHLVCSLIERKTLTPPGKLIDLGGYKVHLWFQGHKSDRKASARASALQSSKTTICPTGLRHRPTIVLDHSLGGIEGYFLIDRLAELTQVCIYDRPGYGWSDCSPKQRCSQEIVRELDLMLSKAKIEPPYILVGDSFGSYNVRLYAHQFPEKVKGIVLTDGLHESGMLNMPLSIVAVKYLFISGFIMSILGSLLGIVRLLGEIGLFEMIKPELKQLSILSRRRVKRSFYHHSHWLTMARELINLNRSSRQLQIAKDFTVPIISIKSKTFFQLSPFTLLLPRKAIDRLRYKMHQGLSSLSRNFESISADNSSHFVWTDEPKIMLQAVKQLLDRE